MSVAQAKFVEDKVNSGNTEGKALQLYLHANKIYLSNFAKKLNKSRSWVYDLFKLEKIPFEYKSLISLHYSVSFQEILDGKINNTSMVVKSSEIQELKQKVQELETKNQFYLDLIKELTKSNK